MRTAFASALAAAGVLAAANATPARAADLGGNCCADLEERVADLEATTVRKGNRKVSLTVSGWVAEQVVFWDDGTESNAYVGGTGSTLATNVKFTGEATIAPGWTAGYVLHLEADGSDTLAGTNSERSDGRGLFTNTTNFVQTEQSYWFIKSDRLGKVGVGLQSAPSDNLAILVDGSGTLVPANWVTFDVGGFNFRNGDVFGPSIITATACNGGGDCYGVPTNNVRYDSPTFRGFSFSASWGEDDVWDVAGRYAGEHHGFKVALAVGYGEVSNYNLFPQGNVLAGGGTIPSQPVTNATLFAPGSSYLQVGAYVQHVATGLFGLVNYGRLEADFIPGYELSGNPIDPRPSFDDETWYVKGGIRSKCTPLGATIFYGEWQQSEVSGLADDIGNPSQNFWGGGVVQEIDSAAMSLWVAYREFSYDDNLLGDAHVEYDDFQMVKAGGLINF